MFGFIIAVLFFYFMINLTMFETRMIAGLFHRNADAETRRRRERKTDRNLLKCGIAILAMFLITWLFIV